MHLNPVRAGLVGKEDRLLAYPWSSRVWYLAAPEHRPSWIRVDRLLGEHGIQQDCPAGRQEFERHMEARRSEEEDASLDATPGEITMHTAPVSTYGLTHFCVT